MKPPIQARRDTVPLQLVHDPIEILRFHFIVPVYREYSNGNLRRLVEALGRQSMHDRLGLLLLVNNSPEVARDKNSPVWKENQDTLAWLKGQKPPFYMEALDLSTQGVSRNMGEIRQRGVERALALAGPELEKEVLIHLDADTRIEEGFLEKVHRLYSSFRGLESVFFLRDYELRNTPSAELLHSHHQFRMKRAVLDFFNARTALSCGVATYQISSRLSAMVKAGGFRPLAQDEDTALTEDLCRETVWIQAHDIEMVTEDRARSDGFTAKKRLKGIVEGRRKKSQVEMWLGSVFGRMELREKLKEITKAPRREYVFYHSLFHAYCTQAWEKVKAGEASYEEAVAEIQRRLEAGLKRKVEVESKRFFGKTLEELRRLPDDLELVHKGEKIVLHPTAHAFPDLILTASLHPGKVMLGVLGPHLAPEEREWLERRIQGRRTLHERDILGRRDFILGMLRGEPVPQPEDCFLRWCQEELHPYRDEVAQGKLSPEEGLSELIGFFPDWLDDYENTPSRADVDALKAGTELIVKVQTETVAGQRAGLLAFLALLQDGAKPFRLR